MHFSCNVAKLVIAISVQSKGLPAITELDHKLKDLRDALPLFTIYAQTSSEALLHFQSDIRDLAQATWRDRGERTGKDYSQV